MASIKNLPPNRIVAVLTPLVFAPLAGAISVTAAEVAPGVNIDESSLTAIFIAGATIAFGKAAQWTKGWQLFEQRDAGSAAPGLTTLDEDELDMDIDLEDAPEFDDMTELDDELEARFAMELEDDFADEDDELMALGSAQEE